MILTVTVSYRIVSCLEMRLHHHRQRHDHHDRDNIDVNDSIHACDVLYVWCDVLYVYMMYMLYVYM